MNQLRKLSLIVIFISSFSINVFSSDITVENADGVFICYNYINDGKELEVTSDHEGIYSGNVVIPEEVTYMNRTRKVTSIGEQAFYRCSELTSVSIPNSVIIIKRAAFANCYALTSIHLGNSLEEIGANAFWWCNSLAAVTFPNSLLTIKGGAFSNCSSLTSISIPDNVTSIEGSAFASCSGLTSLSIGNGITTIEYNTFSRCDNLTTLSIPNSVTSINDEAFINCSGLTSLIIPNSVTSIGKEAFSGCWRIPTLTIPNSVTTIGDRAFAKIDFPTVTSLIENPFSIGNETFSKNTLLNATLYIPKGTIDKYKETEGWRDFTYIEESASSQNTNKQCETPTISYQNGELLFNCSTEDAICQYSIKSDDVKSGYGNNIQLCATYTISVYATKDGYVNSETVNATLCWIDAEPKKDGITNGVTEVRARAVLIKSNGGQLTIEGIDDGQAVELYSLNGEKRGSAVGKNSVVCIDTNVHPGSVVVVKIGDKSMKVIVK